MKLSRSLDGTSGASEGEDGGPGVGVGAPGNAGRDGAPPGCSSGSAIATHLSAPLPGQQIGERKVSSWSWGGGSVEAFFRWRVENTGGVQEKKPLMSGTEQASFGSTGSDARERSAADEEGQEGERFDNEDGEHWKTNPAELGPFKHPTLTLRLQTNRPRRSLFILHFAPGKNGARRHFEQQPRQRARPRNECRTALHL